MTTATPPDTAIADRVSDLRTYLSERQLDGFIVPHTDENQSEYLPPSAERLAWITGFTGSAGTSIILKNKAVLFVDGRYTLQARTQVDSSLFVQVDVMETSPSAWLADNLAEGNRIGHDPWLTTMAEADRLAESCAKAGATLEAVDRNPIDLLWQDRPDPPVGAVTLHPFRHAGRDVSDKLRDMAKHLSEKKADATVLVRADSIAWTLNIRGSDTAHNPAPLAFAILRAEGRTELFIDGRKLSNTVRAGLADHVTVSEADRFAAALDALDGQTLLLDRAATPVAVAEAAERAGCTIINGTDPTVLPKAIKNEVEQAGALRAQRRDGAAMVRFLAWLDREAGTGALDELAVADKLAFFRADTAERDDAELIDISFDTISGAGPNGAIVHYRVTPETSRKLEPGSLYLVDSGGQYRDGTTDITRTVAIGSPTPPMREHFTRVLKGHIALATAVFPAGTTGAQLDALARLPLWVAGLDYAHGTGHGVGSFLSVHEGPANISKRPSAALQPGMILSNEPGYYQPGDYGIRIENLLLVAPADLPNSEAAFLRFETITLCPIDQRLIDTTLMTPEEIAWLDAYHEQLSGALDDLLDKDERAWLAAATRPLDS